MGQKQNVDVKDLQNGPLTQANRQCRDVLCCLLFVGCIGAMIYLGAYGWSQGNPDNIFRGVDQAGNICGDPANSVTKTLKYLYLYNPTNSVSKRTCVDSCPVISGATVTAPTTSIGGTAAVVTWDKTIDSTGNPSPTGAPGASHKVGYQTSLVIGRLCMPDSTLYTSFLNSVSSSLSQVFSQGNLGNFITDIQNNWKYLLVGLGMAIFMGFFVALFLRCFTGCIVWLSLFSIMFFFIGLGLVFLYNGGLFDSSTSSTVSTYLSIPSTGSSQYNKTYGWILIGIGGVFFVVILCCCSRIRLAVAICKCAGAFISTVCTIFFIPILQTIISGGLWAVCLYAMIYLVASAPFVATSNDYYSWVQSYSDPSLYKFYAFVFCTLWSQAFIGAVTIFVIASACCMWYYSHGPGAQLTLPVWRSYKMVFRYHMGSLAFGAFLLALVQFIQFIVELIKKQTQASGAKNKCTQYLFACLRCFLQCLQCLVKFINTQAYIQIALRGKNFCYAAKDGFELAWSNPVRFAVVGGIGSVIMFLGKIMIAAGSAFGFYCMVTYVESIRKNYLAPIYQLIGIIGFIIGTLFMSIYSIAMDTLLQCFIVDETNAKAGNKKGVQWAPEQLAGLIDAENQENPS